RVRPGLAAVGGIGREHVPARDEEEAVELLLELDPVVQGAEIVAEMEHAGRAHSRQHALARGPALGHGRSLLLADGAHWASQALAIRRNTYSAYKIARTRPRHPSRKPPRTTYIERKRPSGFSTRSPRLTGRPRAIQSRAASVEYRF